MLEGVECHAVIDDFSSKDSVGVILTPDSRVQRIELSNPLWARASWRHSSRNCRRYCLRPTAVLTFPCLGSAMETEPKGGESADRVKPELAMSVILSLKKENVWTTNPSCETTKTRVFSHKTRVWLENSIFERLPICFLNS